MTLVISEISAHGIVMAADSAITEEFPQDWKLLSGAEVHDVVRTRAQKIQPIYAINAAVGYWGEIAAIGTTTNKEANIPLDVFIEDFADAVSPCDSLEDTGKRLADEINKRIRIGSIRGGFHICGYFMYKGEKVPATFHAHTGDANSKQGPLVLKKDIPFQVPMKATGKYHAPEDVIAWINNGQIFYTRNGDIEVYARFQLDLTTMFDQLAKGGYGFICPSYTKFESPLEARGRYLALQVETICEFYKLSNMLGTIAKPVTWITISSEGVEHFVRSSDN